MFHLRWPVIAAILGLVAPTAHAEVRLFLSPLEFSQNPSDHVFKLDFQGAAGGSIGDNHLAQWGITFSGQESTIIAEAFRPEFVICCTEPFLILQPVLTHPGPGPLVIDFPPLVRRIGIVMANTTLETMASVRVFDRSGRALASFDVDLSSFRVDVQKLIGLESDNEAIARVVVEYTSGNLDEEVDVLLVDFSSAPVFVRWIPQFVIASLGDGSSFKTEIRIINTTTPFGSEATVSFFDTNGQPLTVTVNGVQTTETTFDEIGPFLSVTLTPTSSEPVLGTARITSDKPFEAAAVFQHSASNGNVLAAAGISADAGGSLRLGPIVKDDDGRSTGIAIVNTSDTATTVKVTINRNLEAPIQLDPIELGPRGHHAFFIEQIYPEINDGNGSVTLQLSSKESIAVTLIETVNGMVSSSLPLTGP